MSSKYDTVAEAGAYATYKNDIVQLIEKLPTNSDIWIVQNLETELLGLAHESDLENPYYYGD